MSTNDIIGRAIDHVALDGSKYSERGRLCLEMRNSSNGYYSGWIQTSDVPKGRYGDEIRQGDPDYPTSWQQVAP